MYAMLRKSFANLVSLTGIMAEYPVGQVPDEEFFSSRDNYPIAVDEECFSSWEDQKLLECYREQPGDLQKRKDLFHEALDRRVGLKYDPKGKCNSMPNALRKELRDARIELYDNLLLLALGAEGEEWNRWTTDQKLWDERATSNFERDSIFKYMMDFIHEDEEIMLKFYRVETDSDEPYIWRQKAFWLVQSIKLYRMYLLHPVIKALMSWDGKNEDGCRKLLDGAKQVFKGTVSRLGRDWSKRSWRNRARLYWLLGLAKHNPISSNGRLGNFNLSFGHFQGPIGTLIREMLAEDESMLLAGLSKYDDGKNEEGCQQRKVRKGLCEKVDDDLGTLHVCSLLAWAAATNDTPFVLLILQHVKEYRRAPVPGRRYDVRLEESWKESWAHALWNAAYNGNAEIVKELLKSDELYSNDSYKDSKMIPLHTAMFLGHTSVVEAFCTDSKNFSFCRREDFKHHPLPLQFAILDCKSQRHMKKVLDILLHRSPEVKSFVEESYRRRELTVSSANTIIVGATLIASITFGGWLQPPLGYNSYYQFAEPFPAPPNSYESYMSIQGHTTIEVFAIFNSLSFFFAIAAMVTGIDTACFIEDLEDVYIVETLEKLRDKLKRTAILFIISLICVLIAFASAGIAILPPITRSQRSMYMTIAVGGLLCLYSIGKMLFFSISKSLQRQKEVKKAGIWFKNKLW